MATKKLSHYELIQLWKKGCDEHRGYFVGKPNETPLNCAQEMQLKNIEIISITGTIVGNDKKGKQIVIAYTIAPYAIDVTDEMEWSNEF